MIRVSDNSVVASTNVAMSGCAVGQFKYTSLANPVTLSANTSYLLVSYEVGSDLFHDWTNTVLTTMSVATVNYGIYTTNGGQTWGPAGGTGNSYVPLDFQYQTPPSQPFVTGKTLAAQRSDSPGWTGFEMMTGGQALTVTSLGRYCAAGNSLTHELRVIRSSDNSVVASTTVSMAGCSEGQFKYATLATPVTLSSNTSYLLVSYEVGTDNFHDWTGLVLTTNSVATVLHGIYTTNGGQTWGPAGGTGNSYVPVDFQYQTSSVTSTDLRWMVTDQLGTPRMIFDQSGSLTVLDQNGNYASGMTRHDYLPFGEELFAGTGGRTTAQGFTGDSTRQKFTQKERDIETGLDHFLSRYYVSMQGRFINPDQPFADQDEHDPQSWNLYAYVSNSPLSYTDPFGLWKKANCDNGGQCWESDRSDDTYASLAKLTGANPKMLAQFFQNETITQGHFFDVSGYSAYVKMEVDSLITNTLNDPRSMVIPAGGGIVDVNKVEAGIGFFSRVASAIGRWFGGGENAGQLVERTIEIVQREGNLVEMVGKSTHGEIRVLTEMTKQGDTLVLKELAIDGPGRGTMGIRELREFARQLGRQQGASEVVIEGGRRLTGANPGRIPHTIRIRVN